MIRRPAHPLFRDEVERVFKACGGKRGTLPFRNRALLVLLWRCGLRCNEAVSLDVADVRLEEPAQVRVRFPKGYERGAKPRSVGLDERSRTILAAWIAKRGDAPGALFVTRHGSRLTNRAVRQTFAALGRRAGLQRRVHPHAFRHTFAAELYAERVGVVEIQQCLGHSSLAVTQCYLKSIGATEVVACTASRSW